MKTTTEALAELAESEHRLREINAELLAAVRAARRAIHAGIDADPTYWADAERKCTAAIARAEGEGR